MGAVRLFLALVVAFDHSRSFCLRPRQLDIPVFYTLGFNAGYAVMFFYIISGFLISFVLRHKYENAGAGAFYESRFIRIFSLYWPMALLTLVCISEAGQRFLHSPLRDEFTSLFLLGIDWNLAFAHYPERNDAAAIWCLDQAWTLGAELTFYILAPFVLRSLRLTFILVALSASVRAAAVFKYGFSAVWTYEFFPSTILFFLFGHLAGVGSERVALLRQPLLSAVLLAGCIVSLMFPTYTDWDTPRFWLSSLCFAAALPGLFMWTKDSVLLNRLGDLSFPLYLVHLVGIQMLERSGFFAAIFKSLGTTEVAIHLAVFSVLLLSIVLAYLAHKIIEQPTASLLRYIVCHCKAAHGKVVELRL